MAPDYSRSDATVTNEWQLEKVELTQGLSSQQAADIPWKDFIKDERLMKLHAH